VNLVAPTRAACSDFLDAAAGDVSLDGKAVPLERLEPVEITFDTQDGRLRGFGCGLWFRIKPLPTGTHSLTLRGRSGNFSTEAHYDLSVSGS